MGRRESASLQASERVLTRSFHPVYANSLMATLNARKGLRDPSSYAHDSTVSLQNMHPAVNGNPAQLGVRNFAVHVEAQSPYHNLSRQKSDASIAIRIDTIKDTQRDTDYDVRLLYDALLFHDAHSAYQFQSADYEGDKCPMGEV